MPKLSVIIGHYPIDPSLDILLEKCVASLKADYDELVLVVNDGIGFGKAFNMGMKYATGDYLLLVSNDVEFTRGSPRQLMMENTVTAPLLKETAPPRGIWGCCLCIPRKIYEEIGGFDERFTMAYWEDDDLAHRYHLGGVKMETVRAVNVFSEGGQTMKFLDKKKAFGDNSTKYLEKWGEEEFKRKQESGY